MTLRRASHALRLRRLPLESSEPVASFALLRLMVVATALIATGALAMPHRTRLALVIVSLMLPWALAVYVVAGRSTQIALHPLVATGDLAILAIAQVLVAEIYAPVRFLAIFLVAAHAHFQGEERGGVVAVFGVVALIVATVVAGAPVHGALLAFDEIVFGVSAISAGLFVGTLRTAESAGRLRSRDLSRRAIEAEAEVRRRLAEALHDGPVQELVSLDMMIDAARRALSQGEPGRAGAALDEASRVSGRSVNALRDEIVGLGPYAFEELSLAAAVEQCAPVWERRYGIRVKLSLDSLDLPVDVRAAFFGIAQEAVANAGRHAEAQIVSVVTLREGGDALLRVSDDGHGFTAQPLGPRAVRHIGLASMRERAELNGGSLEIESGPRGTVVTARVPLPAKPRGVRVTGAAGTG